MKNHESRQRDVESDDEFKDDGQWSMDVRYGGTYFDEADESLRAFQAEKSLNRRHWHYRHAAES